MLFNKSELVAAVVAAAEPSAPVVAPAPSAANAKARVADILRHPEAQGRRALAERLAFETDMSVEQCAAILGAAPKEATAPAIPAARRSADVGALTALGQTGASPAATGDYTVIWARVVARVNAPIVAQKAALGL
jgi:hypothetical protein